MVSAASADIADRQGLEAAVIISDQHEAPLEDDRMPNGGYPLHMVLKPRRSADYVIHAEGARVRLFTAEAWEESRGGATPLLELEADEAAALARFVMHWAPESASGELVQRPNVAYDV
jgi:hypothetical protein